MINTQAIAKTATQTIVRSLGNAKTLIFSWANQNKKEILLGSGIAAMVTSTVLAVKATPNAVRMYDAYSEQNGCPDTITTIKLVWKNYIPAAVSAGLGVASILGAGYLANQENAMLAAAYSLSQEQLSDYIKAAKDSKNKDSILDDVAQSQLDNHPYSESDQANLPKLGGDTLFFDSYSGRYFKSDINAMDKCINYANHFLVMNGQMTLNDIYEIIGLESTTLGDYFTYYASDDLIEINYSSKLTSDNEPCVVMQFSTLPRFEDR